MTATKSSVEESGSTANAAPTDVLAADDEVPLISVVMPTMNEEAGIEECITRIKTAFAELDVTGEIVISDDSTDRTPEIARRMGARVLSPDEEGYGYAYRYAFEHARGEYVVMGDADTTYDFEELPRLFEKVRSGEADMVMGSRLDGTIKPGSMPPLHQHIGNPLLTRFLNVFYDAGVSDAHSGFRVLSRDALETLELGTDGMEFASEMIMDAGAKDLNIEEVPITYHEREGEATLESFRDGWRHVRFMLVNAPDYLFSIPGMALGVLGLSIMSLGLFDVAVAGQPIGVHSMIAGSLMLLTGFQVGSFGLLTDLATNPIRSPQDPITRWIRDEFSLARGVALGGSLLVAGSAGASWLVYEWYASGYAELPALSADIAAFTCIVLGVQVIFLSFFGSIVVDQNQP